MCIDNKYKKNSVVDKLLLHLAIVVSQIGGKVSEMAGNLFFGIKEAAQFTLAA